jgi:hypothetical protein
MQKMNILSLLFSLSFPILGAGLTLRSYIILRQWQVLAASTNSLAFSLLISTVALQLIVFTAQVNHLSLFITSFLLFQSFAFLVLLLSLGILSFFGKINTTVISSEGRGKRVHYV